MDDIAASFRQEALELTGKLESLLLSLEGHPDPRACVDDIFRVMHTLKGGAGMCGFPEIQDLAHRYETLFDRMREGHLEISGHVIDLTLQGKDALEALLQSGGEADTTRLLEALGALIGDTALDSQPASAATQPAATASDSYLFFSPDQAIFERGLDPDKVLAELQTLGTCHIVSHEGDESWEQQKARKTCLTVWEIFLRSTRSVSEIEEAFLFYDPDEYRIFPLASGTETISPELAALLLRLHPGTADAAACLLEGFAGLTHETAGETVPVAEKPAMQKMQHAETADAGSTVPVPSARLDELMNLVSDLVTQTATLEARLNRSDDLQLRDAAEQLSKLTKRFRTNALDMRLVPVGGLLTRFRRQIRDLSKELGKEVTLILEGDEVEIDKTILKSIETPLIHILRNSIDHGLEFPEERLERGKTREGLIKVSALHSGANVIVQVQDDGRGIDLGKVRETALRKGYIQSDDDISDDGLLALILEPGFSTSENVSMVSGRGVGMDVVKRELNSIGGSLEVFTEKDLGTTITLKLPTTLTIMDTLMVEVDRSTVLVPLPDIEYCYNISSSAVLNSTNSYLEYNRRLVPFLNLRERFHFPQSTASEMIVLILNKFDKTYAIVADRIAGEYQAVIKPLGDLFANQPYFTGASIMVNGRVALILDTNSLFSQFERNQSPSYGKISH